MSVGARPRASSSLGASLLLFTALVAAPIGESSPDIPIRYKLALSGGEWAAFRFNVTAGDDLRIDATSLVCHGTTDSHRSVIGSGWLLIVDGTASEDPAILVPSKLEWYPGADMVAIGAEGTHVRLPDRATGGGCIRLATGYGGGLNVERSITLIAIQMAPLAHVELEAKWTTGVTSFDVRTGNGISATKGEFEHGVHANIYSGWADAGAGLGLMKTVTTTSDTIGYYLPSFDLLSAGVSKWACTENGRDCGIPDSFGYIPLEGTGTTEWNFVIDADARAGETPYLALAVVPLGSNDYLS